MTPTIIGVALGLVLFIVGLFTFLAGLSVYLRNLLMVGVTGMDGSSGGKNGGKDGTKGSTVWDAVIKFFDFMKDFKLKTKEGVVLMVFGVILMAVGIGVATGTSPFPSLGSQ
jgi:uncharacterized membrane protein YhaH (DUF805 family)